MDKEDEIFPGEHKQWVGGCNRQGVDTCLNGRVGAELLRDKIQIVNELTDVFLDFFLYRPANTGSFIPLK